MTALRTDFEAWGPAQTEAGLGATKWVNTNVRITEPNTSKKE
jgi:hypothetical protein